MDWGFYSCILLIVNSLPCFSSLGARATVPKDGQQSSKMTFFVGHSKHKGSLGRDGGAESRFIESGSLYRA